MFNDGPQISTGPSLMSGSWGLNESSTLTLFATGLVNIPMEKCLADSTALCVDVALKTNAFYEHVTLNFYFISLFVNDFFSFLS